MAGATRSRTPQATPSDGMDLDADSANHDDNIIRLPIPSPPPLTTPESYDPFRDQHTPLIVDNGASHIRYGWSSFEVPRTNVNAMAKYKERKHNKPLLLFGEAIEAESGAKGQTKTPWEGDVLLNSDALENALDYVFVQLGVDSHTVDHPVLMTERLCSPLHSRALTSELMFEQYTVPSLAYCVDSIMSFYHNNPPEDPTSFTSDGLVISFNTASTSVVPILNGKGILSHAKRIPWGASQSAEYLLKLVQLKYPSFPTRVTSAQSSWMLRTCCEFATDYPALLRTFNDPNNLRVAGRVVQFPFIVPLADEKTEEELAKLAEKRKEQGRKLQEMAAKTRLEKLIQKEKDLEYLINLRENKGESKREWNHTLQAEGFDGEEALAEAIKNTETHLKKARKKDADGDDTPVAEEPSFPLVDVPDADLDEEGLKEKRRQKLMKAGIEARARAKREKEREREEKEIEERKDQEEREADLSGWVSKRRKEQEMLMSRIKERNRRKAALSDRKSAAAQARMKSIATLAADDRVPKKKRKAGTEDTFGADDADWAIYRKINLSAESSDEEGDFAQLHQVEQKLLAYDPAFTTQQTHASMTTQQSALLSAFRPQYQQGDVQGLAKVHLNVERWRACEAWFSPAMAGVDSAGLGEVLQMVLGRFSDSDKGRLVKNVFVTGTPAQLRGLIPRLHATLRPILPSEIPIDIRRALDPSLDAWKGMADFARTGGLPDVSVTRAEYQEWGSERIKNWWGGNWR